MFSVDYCRMTLNSPPSPIRFRLLTRSLTVASCIVGIMCIVCYVPAYIFKILALERFIKSQKRLSVARVFSHSHSILNMSVEKNVSIANPLGREL